MAIWKIAPALITGNSVILKPAEQSPMSAIKIGAYYLRQELPDGVFSVLPGDGPITGKSLCLHNDIDCVAFTGSGEVGKLVLQYSGQSNMKRVQLECGGKSPNIIFEIVKILMQLQKLLHMQFLVIKERFVLQAPDL